MFVTGFAIGVASAMQPIGMTPIQEKAMYYEETVIDNVLHWRGVPEGAWKRVTSTKQLALHYMRLLSGDDRLDIISKIGSDTRNVA